MALLIVSCSLHPTSNSRKLVHHIRDTLTHVEQPCQFLDLADYSLPLCDGYESYNHPDVKSVQNQVKNAEAIIMALPIYNFGVSAAAKNFIELVGEQIEGKVFGFICAAGGEKSYMSVMSLANSLMLDFHCLIVPKFVYFNDKAKKQESGDIEKRLEELIKTVSRLKKAWKMCRS